MRTIQWNDSYSVGVARLDEQHRRILETINLLAESLETPWKPMPLSQILGGLIDYVKLHFETEEQLLAEQSYPGLLGQKNEHKEFRRKIVGFCMDALGNQTSVPKEVLEYLQAWWLDHILEKDMMYRVFLNDRGIT